MTGLLKTANGKKVFPFLKWVGGKSSIIDFLFMRIPTRGEVLVEPFVGCGVLFLNTSYERYILADTNRDLINTYQLLQDDPDALISELNKLWDPDFVNKDAYLKLRDEFNKDPFEKSLRRSSIFIFMNRFGFHGLCRYNSEGLFNVPFGAKSEKLPDFDDFKGKLMDFAAKSQKNVEFFCQDFSETFAISPKNSVIYCDPPYAPINDKTFTGYGGYPFTLDDQRRLHCMAKDFLKNNDEGKVFISNHSTEFITELYYDAACIDNFQVVRKVAMHADERDEVTEILATFEGGKVK